MFVLISFPQTIYEQQNSALVRGTKNLALLEPQYGSFISRIFQSISRIFPFYGIGQNYGNWNFQHFLMQYFQNILILWERSIFFLFFQFFRFTHCPPYHRSLQQLFACTSQWPGAAKGRHLCKDSSAKCPDRPPGGMVEYMTSSTHNA